MAYGKPLEPFWRMNYDSYHAWLFSADFVNFILVLSAQLFVKSAQ